MKKIRKNKNWRVLFVKSKVYLLNVVNSKQILLDSSKQQTLFLLELLDEMFNKGQVLRAFQKKYPKFGKKWADHYLNLLQKEKILEYIEKQPEELSEEYLLGLDRQIDFLSELNKKSSYENQLLLKKTRIAVLGLGSVSHYVILPLVASGIGYFKCVDFDIIEKRNIGRQPIFRSEDVGKQKSQVVASFIKNIGKGIKVEAISKKLNSESDITSVINDCDLVIQCCDLPRFVIHRWINNVCLRLQKPNILVYSGRVGPFNIPFKTACYGCLETALRKKFVLYDKLVENIAKGEFTRFPELAVVGNLSGVLAAKEITGHLLRIKSQTYNGFFDINPFSLKIILHNLPRQKDCYACSKISQ